MPRTMRGACEGRSVDTWTPSPPHGLLSMRPNAAPSLDPDCSAPRVAGVRGAGGGPGAATPEAALPAHRDRSAAQRRGVRLRAAASDRTLRPGVLADHAAGL